MTKIRRALLSVSDKSGLVELARSLHSAGAELVASGGTAKALTDAGLPVVSVEKWAGAHELLGGRIKTLHPRIHAGILARREDASDSKDLRELGSDYIDLVVVNFYPFREVVASGKSLSEVIEAIDVGGPTMARAAAKNFNDVVVLSAPSDYLEFLEGFLKGEISDELRQRFAARTFARLVAYDAAIAEHLSNGELVGLSLERAQDCRYGENPHQKGALFVEVGKARTGLAALRQLQGKALSYNNLQDAHGALMLAREFECCAAVIIKHATPCGVGLALTPAQAVRRALETDPVSAFGGIVALTKALD
ncbi:MAG: bifunctional phosphoribosylaminoimidazolecarboxamide formyltransferase/IMP cyclohydrolase, partial [Calditrichaeota bacterium]|nr:bifunctional phosphoribosylaminoimidazolecarboxamide formyltransferase/IMP cyclohydrolase [Calditrichota bacterium]